VQLTSSLIEGMRDPEYVLRWKEGKPNLESLRTRRLRLRQHGIAIKQSHRNRAKSRLIRRIDQRFRSSLSRSRRHHSLIILIFA
jgi:hypothetical protein